MTETEQELFPDVFASDVTTAQEVLAALGVAVYTTDARGVLTFYNEAAAELWGRRPAVGIDLWCGSWQILSPDGTVLPHDQCPMAVSLKENRPVRGAEAILVRPDGKRTWFMPYPTPLRDESGALVGGVNVLVDITERKQAELAIRESEGRYRELLEGIGVAVYVTDPEGRITLFNRAAAEMWGREPEIGVDMWCGSLRMLRADGSVLPHEECPMAIALKEGRPTHGSEAMIERPDGTGIWVAPYPTPLFNAAGELTGAINVFIDITAEKQAKAALVDSEEQLRDFFENSPVPLNLLARDGTILRANQAELDMLGYEEDEYVGRGIAEFHADKAAIDDILSRLARGEVLHEYEAALRCKDGTTKLVLIDSSVLWRDGEFVHTRCLTRDITERKKAEDSVYHLAAIVGSSDDAIVSKDLNGIVQSWNPGAERLFGYRAEEMVGRSIRTIIPEEHQFEEDEVLSRVRSGEPVEHFETVRRRKDGSYLPISLTVSPMRDREGRIIGASKIARDISQQKQAEEEMKAAAALKDQFLGLVSHELRTPISTVIANALVLLRRGDMLSEMDKTQALQDIASEGEKLQSVIENLLLLTRVEATRNLEQETVSLSDVVAQHVRAFAERRPSREISIEGEPGISSVRGQETLLSIVLENLLGNADKYSPPSSMIAVRLNPNADGEAEVHVLDGGIGIDETDLENLFTPFYRSEAAQESATGLGLGLAVCKRIVEAYGGRIWAVRRPEGGSDFAFALPVKK